MRQRRWQDHDPPKTRHVRYAATLVAIVLGLVLAGSPNAGAKIRRESWVWDPGVEAIAHRVEQLRGLRFRYPVQVERRKAGAVSAPNRVHGDSAALARDLRHLQALGVVPLATTAADLASGASRHPLGQYHPETESITVWRPQMDALTRVVIAHELSHALDDQHYHFARIDQSLASQTAGNARRAAVEGDARRIENAYFASLSVTQQRLASRSYQDLHEQAVAHVTDPSAVEWNAVVADAPYTLGLQLTRLANTSGGEPALRALLTSRTLDDLTVLDPAPTASRSRPWRRIDAPLRPGERRDGHDASGALDVYLLLASRTNPDLAFRAVDASTGAGTVWFKRNGVACAHVALRSQPNRTDDVIRGMDAFVARAGPAADRQIIGQDVILTTCAGSPPLKPGAIGIAELVLAARDRALIDTAPGHATSQDRECIANTILQDSQYALDLRTTSARGLGGADPSFAAALQRARAVCQMIT